MKELRLKTETLGYPIEAVITLLDDGAHVLLTGGCRTHVGAVSRALPGEDTQTVQYPTHRDGLVSERWAGRLALLLQRQVVVCCGIHYDNVSREDIRRIVAAADKLLEEAEISLRQ